ncbi:MAG: FkbM family methyltransferase [Pseudomonadota bacterium]
MDIGANTGQFAARLRATGWSGKIVSVEPLPDEHAEISAAAKSDARWTVADRTALGAERGEIILYRYADSSLTSALKPLQDSAHFGAPTEVPTPVTTLDELMGSLGLDPARTFVKIDVQGLEMQVIAGGGGTLAKAPGATIELALSRIYEGEPGYLDVLTALDAHGLVPVYFCHVTSRRRMQPEAQMDAILLRR